MRTLSLVLVLACTRTSEPTQLADCPDAPCRQRWVMARWPVDPEGALAAIHTMDPIEQLALVAALTEAHPGETRVLCAALSGKAKERCETLNSRPHLHVTTGEGWRLPFTKVVEEAAIASPWPSTHTTSTDCDGAPAENACWTAAAQAAAQHGQAAAAAATCQRIEEEKWRDECYFQSAEAAIRRQADHSLPVERVPDAARLCLGSGAYQARCLIHLSHRIGALAPASDTPAEGAWRALLQASAAAQQALAPHSEAVSRRLADRTWAVALRNAYSRAQAVTGTPLAILPAAAAPHVRAAAPRALIEESTARRPSLTTLSAALLAALHLQGDADGATAPAADQKIRDLWQEQRPSEQDLPWIHYLGDPRRTISDDPDSDAIICLLEASARARPPLLRPLRDGLSHDDERVRWTAVRLLQALDVEGDWRVLVAADPSALVQGRLQ